jgi:hypothetical protein
VLAARLYGGLHHLGGRREGGVPIATEKKTTIFI